MLSSKSPTVLVVEDDPALRAMYRAMLQMDGFAVAAVEDGIGALRQLDISTPAAVVLDLGLPRLGGRDVHREIVGRVDTRDIPVVVVTAGDTNDLNPDDFACILRKPCDPEKVVSAVRHCLRRAVV